jgi:hypothetical protein
VRAFGDPDRDAYHECSAHNWNASRNKLYSADAAQWDTLRAAGWLDYGVVFYTPSSGETVFTTTLASSSAALRYYYYRDGAERSFRGLSGQTIAPAFFVLAQPAPEALPLYRVLYSLAFGSHQHDELAVGRAAFENLYGQGVHQQSFSVTYSWTGDPPSALVLEALDAGCPFEGWIGDHALPAEGSFEAWTTLDAIRTAAPYREVYLNGQYDPPSVPRPIARAFVAPSSTTRAMDFAYRPADGETFTAADPECNEANFQCDSATLHTYASASFDVTFNGVETDRFSLMPQLGQLWTLYSDFDAGVTGYLRMTARAPATMADGSFLYASMDVTAIASARRFPQIVITDESDVPVWIMHRSDPSVGRSLIVDIDGDWPSRVAVETCAGSWSAQFRCPTADLRYSWPDRIAPIDEIADRTRPDRMTRLEIYASTQRTYVFVDGRPYGCADHDPGTTPSGPVRVTFGEALFHSGSDTQIRDQLEGGFFARHAQTLSDRRYGPLGFSNAVAAPAWDATWPCVRVTP